MKLLEGVIRKHVEYTASPLGRRILANWSEMVPRFVKVLPHEYKRVLAKREESGLKFNIKLGVTSSNAVAAGERAG